MLIMIQSIDTDVIEGDDVDVDPDVDVFSAAFN